MMSKITKYIAEAITQMMKWTVDILNSLYRKFLSAILRSSLAIMLVINLFILTQYQYLIVLCQPSRFNHFWKINTNKELLAQMQLH